MARLNEALAPTESIDALKRRFVRQNREIARANSTQSLRIRNLENETARLLSENIGLREQIIKLETGLTKYHTQQVYEHVNRVKAMLDQKVQELGQVVNELGLAQYQYGPQASVRRSINSATGSPVHASTERQWRNGLAPLESTRSHLEGKMPTIPEDKQYPRWTWRTGNILSLLPGTTDTDDTTDSPDLGPPPVAHFETEDVPGVPSSSNTDGQGYGFAPETSTLTASIEVRKKRRESGNVFEFKKTSNPDSGVNEQIGLSPDRVSDDSSYPLRAGAKRKLSSKDEEPSDTWDDVEVKELKTTRSTTAMGRRENAVFSELSADDSRGGSNRNLRTIGAAKNREIDQSKNDVSMNSTWRQALQPRSTNMDPTSPSKQSRITEEVGEVIPVKPKFLSRNSSVNRKREPKPDPREAEQKETHSDEDVRTIQEKGAHNESEKNEVEQQESHPEPETLADNHDFQRASSEPVKTQGDARDTPIPSEPGGANTDGAMSGARPSRRPRAGINYAEPNLRDKMRRPTKELVDAVTGEGKTQQKNHIKREDGQSEHEERVGPSIKPRSLVIKREEEQESSSSWKDLPSASLSHDNLSETRNPGESENLGSLRGKLAASRARSRSPTTSSQAVDGRGHRRSSSGSQIAISALMARTGSRRTAAAAAVKEPGNQASSPADDSPQTSNTYELSGSSLSSTLEAENQSTPPPTRIARRHSTIGNSNSATTNSSGSTSHESTDRSTRPKPGGHRRTQTVATTTDGKHPPPPPTPPGQESTEDHHHPGGLKSVKGPGKSSTSTSRTMGALERAAARRRSMML